MGNHHNNHTYQWKLLRAGSLWLDGGGVFGLIPKVIWSKMTPVDERNRIPLQTNCLLLEGGGGRILIETGFGDKWDAKSRDIFGFEERTIVDALYEENVTPESIDAVILSHLHFDHAGGLTRWDDNRKPVSTFPNARIIVQKTEWDDALANKSTMKHSYVRANFDPIAHQVESIEGEAEVAPGIHVFPVPGHTWGHQMVRFADEDGIVCFTGDCLPTQNHAGLGYSLGFDMMPYENMLTKRALLKRAKAEQWRLVLAHEAGNPLATVASGEQDSAELALQEVPSTLPLSSS